jgi:Delta6-protoilludene synthase
MKNRFIKANEEFCKSIVEQVTKSSSPNWKDVEEYFTLRRRTIGARPGFVFAEYIYGLDIGEEVLHSEQIRALEKHATQIIILYNDMLSYRAEGPDHLYNTVAVLCRLHHISVQEAFDIIEKMLEDCFTGWYEAMSKLPSWGGDTDRQIELYIRGMKGHIIANANWRYVDLSYPQKHQKLTYHVVSRASATSAMTARWLNSRGLFSLSGSSYWWEVTTKMKEILCPN